LKKNYFIPEYKFLLLKQSSTHFLAKKHKKIAFLQTPLCKIKNIFVFLQLLLGM